MSNQIIIIATDSATEFKIAKSLNNNDTKIYLWNSFCEEENIKSIIKEIEKKSDEYKIRENYTSWIYELTTIKNNNKTIIDSLRLESGFSFWWTTLIIEQSLTKQPSINDVLKLIFIETISKEYKPKSIKFIGKSYTISSVINNFCNNLGISFIQTNSTKKSYFKLLSKFNNLKLLILGIGSSLFFLLKHSSIQKHNFKRNWNNKKSILFVDYLDNLDNESLKKGDFKSNYWNDLPLFCKQLNLDCSYIHLYSTNSQISSLKSATNLINSFNKSGNSKHLLLESMYNWKMTLRSIYLMINWYVNFNNIDDLFYDIPVNKGMMRPWILLKSDLKRSLFGPLGAMNLIYHELFNVILKNIEHKDIILFLCENQGWERSLSFLTKKYKHGFQFGYAHSSIRYWDLRYFLDSKFRNIQPHEDMLLCNGELAFKQHKLFYKNCTNIKVVEALRYKYLFKKSNRNLNNTIRNKTILILGDYIPSATNRILSMLSEINIGSEFKIIFKPHPNFLPNSKILNNINATISNAKLDELFLIADIAICGASTSASIDAFIYGLKTIVVTNDSELNICPLRNFHEVSFVYQSEDLFKYLSEFSIKRPQDPNTIFHWTDNLYSWEKNINKII